MASAQGLQTKILRRAKSPEDYAVYRAALEWGLTDPIVIESRDDFKSEFRWKDRLEPFHNQVQNLITFCRRLPVTLLADDVGLGKTISAGLVASELIARNRVAKILIVAPKLLGEQWKDELGTKFDIPGEVVTGSKLISAEPDDVGAVITTYHSARSHLEKIPDDRFDMLVLDEAHKLRNLYGTDAAPQVAKVFQRALQQRRFRYVLMLTATPIQNRLWDLYSLVDLLTVARGHENPFGSEGLFARRFIDDKRETARVLKSEARDEFRKIVYGYMSRVRRGDANLNFPERKIELHKVKPSPAELALIKTIAEPIQKLNRLAQIGILQALTSSPHALMSHLQTMARNGTVPMGLFEAVKAIVTPMKTSAKLEGLGQLVSMLKEQNPDSWRMVVFTGRRETQTTIQAFLEQLGLKVGIINGSSGPRNQETIARFRASPPEIRAIVSTEAGSEGVNLQVANVLINFDLPWNPMIVEQRIGRVQRLGSVHRHVVIYNVMLQGTFEEYIVGRLMTKLQMATDAIGDIESLLEASGVGDGEEGAGFDERIRELVIAALAGQDMKASAEKIARSIDAAKKTLEDEKENIEATLGSQDGYGYVGPQTPTLAKIEPSMAFEPFVRAAFASLGGIVKDVAPGILRVTSKGAPELVRLTEEAGPEYAKIPLYRPGSPAFLRLVDRVTASGLHQVYDADDEPQQQIGQLAREWVSGFNGSLSDVSVQSAQRRFDGHAVARVRATTAHDSYERLVDVACNPVDHTRPIEALDGLPDLLQQPDAAGVDGRRVLSEAQRDPNIVEFNRFYLERRDAELNSAGKDARRRKKLEDEFTPQIDATLVALDGQVSQSANLKVRYRLDSQPYESDLVIVPSEGRIERAPALETCALTRVEVPADCLSSCVLSGVRALKHRLARSEVSGRYALPEHLLRCTVSGKAILVDEAGMSDITNNVVDRTLLKTCAVTGRKGEAEHFGQCAFTSGDVLTDQLGTSEASGRLYRLDQEVSSVVSGKRGHAREFVRCQETKRTLLPREAERCAKTGRIVAPDVLQSCAVTGKRVLPSELRTSSVSGKRALAEHLVSSSLSDAIFLEDEGVRSAYGKFCAPVEARRCQWSGAVTHPDDLKICALLDLSVHFQYLSDGSRRLQPVEELLAGRRRAADAREKWDIILPSVSSAVNAKRCQIESGQLSPDGQMLALAVEVKSLLGLRTQHAAMLYSLKDNVILGRIAVVKRDGHGGFRP